MNELNYTLAAVQKMNAEAKGDPFDLTAEEIKPVEVREIDLSLESIIRREGDGTAQHTRGFRG
jgi:hypothetical protein